MICIYIEAVKRMKGHQYHSKIISNISTPVCGVGSGTGQQGRPCMAPFVTLAVRDVIIVVGDKGLYHLNPLFRGSSVGTAVPINAGESRLGGERTARERDEDT